MCSWTQTHGKPSALASLVLGLQCTSFSVNFCTHQKITWYKQSMSNENMRGWIIEVLSFDFLTAKKDSVSDVTEALKILKGLISLIGKNGSNDLLLCLTGDECQLLSVAREQFVCQTLCICQVLWGPWRMFPPVHPHPPHVLSITDRKYTHSPCHLYQFSPAHPHVLLSGQLVSPGNWLHLLCHTQDAAEPCEWGLRNFSGGMCHTDVFLHILWYNWVLPIGSHGLWPLHGHMCPTTLCNPNESWCMCPFGNSFMGNGMYCRVGTDQFYFLLELLWTLWDRPLLLWPSTSPGTCLWRYIPKWSCNLCGSSSLHI